MLKEISITDISGFKIGSAENKEAMTGCTVFLSEKGALCGADVRGGAPASRENALLNPMASNDAVNAVVLSGGSAFGLSSADGVMKYLEERNIGFPTADGVVPIVCASCLYDLGIGDKTIRPDAQMGYQACLNSENNLFQEGSFGAGCGATVGKVMGMDHAMKTGQGCYAMQLGDLMVGAFVALNAVGDIYDPANGQKIAGIRDPETHKWISAEEALYALQDPNLFHQNTTIGVILTNADLSKSDLTKVSGMAHDGYARCIRPVHTMFDGDTIYTLSTRTVKADVSVVGTLAASVMEKAILRAAQPDKLF